MTFFDYTLLSQSVADTTIPLALENDVGIILGSPLAASLLAGPEPVFHGDNEDKSNSDGTLTPSAIGGPTDPQVIPYAHRMWEWCQDRELNIRDLAMQFVLNAPVKGNGIVLTGSANLQQFHEVYESATTDVSETVWQEFVSEFGVRN